MTNIKLIGVDIKLIGVDIKLIGVDIFNYSIWLFWSIKNNSIIRIDNKLDKWIISSVFYVYNICVVV